MLFGFLLVMQTNLLGRMDRWRSEGAAYPAMINISFLHMSFWALLGLLITAWVIPAGPYNTPAPVQAAIDKTLTVGSDFVRLAGPLQSNKVIPVHTYAGVLPFQGSINLGERELLAVRVTDPTVQGPLLLRGSVYDQYEGGGWRAGDRREVDFPPSSVSRVQDDMENEGLEGMVVPLEVRLEAKSVVGTVVFTAGETLAVNRELRAEVPAGSIERVSPDLGMGGRYLRDEEILRERLEPGMIGLQVVRGEYGRVRYVDVVKLDENGVLGDAVLLDPGNRIKRNRTYSVTAFVPGFTPDGLRASGYTYPSWVVAQYLQLPEDLPESVRSLAAQLAVGEENAYDKAKAFEDYLRQYPVDYDVPDTPPGRDTVEYFLFESRRGYFDYHASAMVVMLRAQGVPARLAVGFVAEENDIDASTGEYMLRDRNSYAWPEVYFPEHGWVAFNPTPDRPADLRPSVNPDAAAANGFDDSILEQLPISSSEGAFIPPEGEKAKPLPEGGLPLAGAAGSGNRPWATLAVAGFVAAVGGAVFLGWQRSVAGMPYPQQMWEKTVRLASWGANPPAAGQTPHEYAAHLQKRFRGAGDFRALADAYTRSRFGKREPDADEAERLRQMWPEARGAMMRGILARPFRGRGSRDNRGA
jgi:transglutaminase-like putative cysteine protease